MPRAVGLDIGTRMLKLVELSGSAKSFKVTKMLVRPVPRTEGEGAAEQDAATLAALVRDLFREARLSTDDVCASFDAGTTIFREITVPVQSTDKLDDVIRFEAENHLHGRSIEDVVVNWVKTGDTKEGSQVIVMAAPKADLAADLAVLSEAGIDPASVDLDATAIYTACHASGVFEEHPSVIVIEIGARTTNLLLVDNGNLKAVRSFLVGSDTVTAGIQQDASLPPGEAERRALTSGPDPGALILPASDLAPATSETEKGVAELERDAALARREDLVRKLHREVTRSYASTRIETPPQRILVAGGGSLLPGVMDALKERFGMEVQPLNLLARIGCPATGDDADFQEAVAPPAVGCALRLLGADPLGVELRREEFAPSNLFDVVRGALATAVTLLVLVLLALVLVTKNRLSDAQAAYLPQAESKPTTPGSEAVKIFMEVEKKYLQEMNSYDDKKAQDEARKAREALYAAHYDATLLPSILAKIRQHHTKLERDLGLSKDIPKIESALLVWVEVWKALATIPRNELGFFKVYKMNVTQTGASIGIEIAELQKLDRIQEALATNVYLKGRTKGIVRNPFPRNQTSGNFIGSFDVPFQDPSR
jgi:type IV pilus assembly protein PilM